MMFHAGSFFKLIYFKLFLCVFPVGVISGFGNSELNLTSEDISKMTSQKGCWMSCDCNMCVNLIGVQPICNRPPYSVCVCVSSATVSACHLCRLTGLISWSDEQTEEGWQDGRLTVEGSFF